MRLWKFGIERQGFLIALNRFSKLAHLAVTHAEIVEQGWIRQTKIGRGGEILRGLRIIFALMDSDGNGTVSLQEFQAAHERIFKSMDANKDGVLTLDEIQSFMTGQTGPGSQQ